LTGALGAWQQYLTSKQQSGHLLMMVKSKVLTYELPLPPVPPFTPYAIRESARFVHVSSYYLPVKPHRPRVTADEYAVLGAQLPYELSLDGAYLVDVTDPALYDQHPAILRRPYWYKVSVYYDIVTQTECVVLEYGDCARAARPPLVRIHSESIFSRFPLKARPAPVPHMPSWTLTLAHLCMGVCVCWVGTQSAPYRHKYQEAIYKIVRNGVGMVILFYHDGRGRGLCVLTRTDMCTRAQRSSPPPGGDGYRGSFVIEQEARLAPRGSLPGPSRVSACAPAPAHHPPDPCVCV
jgi:hypothetical protein